MRLASPWVLLLLLLVPAVFLLRHRRRATGAVRFSTTEAASRLRASLRQRFLWLPSGLRGLALVLMIFALSRPQEGIEEVRDVSRGIAIEMVVDRSGSMGAEMSFAGEQATRLDAVKRVFEEFVNGNGDDLPGRPNDLVGMVTFARYPDTACPLTLAHGALGRFLEKVQLVQMRSEDGTAIGDAIALAAARLRKTEESIAGQGHGGGSDYEIKSKVMILLTDGENNAGKRSPLDAAKLAKEWGIKIYTIGVGGGESMTTIKTPFGDYKVPMGGGVDQSTLKAVAEETGGLFRMAEDAESLRAVYREIDELEKSEIESVRYMDYRERFTPFALAALLLLALEVALSSTVFRRLP